MKEYTLREYTQEEYEADMKKLLKDKGLHGAVEVYTDEINEVTSCLSYVGHRSVQEALCDILYLIQLSEEKKK